MQARFQSWRGVILPVAAGITAALLAFAPVSGAAAENWSITNFDSRIQIERSGMLDVSETIQADFGSSQHGIYRDIPMVYSYNQQSNRVYRVRVTSVTNAAGQPWPYTAGRQGAYFQVKIGDPNRTVTGLQTYRLSYEVDGALNAFNDHDELYWNVNGGNWQVAMNRVAATLSLPANGVTAAACYQGAAGATATCRYAATDNGGSYETTQPLAAGEQLTVVLGFKKGLVAAPMPILEARPRAFVDYFTLSPATAIATVLLLALVVGWVLWMWWRSGRDYEYAKVYYRGQDPGPEQVHPLFRHEAIVPGYEPPNGLRPAELGLLLDESADTKDVTATIIDLAVRGYLRIEEVGQRDWNLVATGKDPADLLSYERTIFYGLFTARKSVRVSDLKEHFRSTLNLAETSLYDDAMQQRWFAANPRTIRLQWIAVGSGVAVIGAAVSAGLGALFGWGLLGLPIVLGGVLLVAGSGLMPRRTGLGRDLFEKTLGFRLYMNSAEKAQQKFAEAANLFTRYLPYAIVFGCVQRWARAFRGIDADQATRGWYLGPTPFNLLLFSSSLQSFSGQLGSAIAATPGSSGRSGFGGGGFAGGGGGGGGGGAW